MANEKSTEKSKALAGAASAAVLGAKAPKNVLGYEKVHHGTRTLAASESIKRTGLKKSLSGTGIGREDVSLGAAKASEIKGKVFTTKQKILADAHRQDMFGRKPGATITAKVPYRAKSRLAEDAVLKRNAEAHTGAMGKGLKKQVDNLRIYKHSIHQRFIKGPEYKGTKQFATKGNIRRYLGQAGGKARFAKGVAQAVGAGASGLYAAAHALKAAKAD